MARVHRIGQKHVVHVYRLLSSGTIEERILQRAEKKLLLSEIVNRDSEDQNDDDDVRPTGMGIFKDIKFGCDAVFGDGSSNELSSLEDIEIITDRNRSESDTVGKLKGDTKLDAETIVVNQDARSSEVFGGVNFGEVR